MKFFPVRFIFLLSAAVFLPLSLCAEKSLAEKLAKNVSRSKRGEVVIRHIPQVGQRKNFCAPASVEMILRYFDAKINQRRLGRLFESSRRRGTTTDDIIKEFSKGKLRQFSITEVYNLFRNQEEYAALLKAYTDAPGLSRRKKRKLKRTNPRKATEIFDQMDPNIARKAFAVQRVPLIEKLGQTTQSHIDAGIPLLWSVFMNLDPHDRGKGGHMRIIVGYVRDNDVITEIIYRDPWGKHARYKKMSLADAGAMTRAFFVILPKSLAAARR